MKKSLLFLWVLAYCSGNSFGQAGWWTWISGSNIPGSAGVYGIQGIPSINNFPPGAYEYVEWKDKQGNFWVYGGTYPNMSDLWKYDPMTNEWTWIKGNGMQYQLPVYGTKGVGDPANSPGERSYGAISIVDTAGNLWLFGGSDLINDLWKYEISNNEWIWMSGDSISYGIGTHGIQGIPNIMNVPGGRAETSSGWIDSSNNLWIFGGWGVDDAGATDNLNDLMKYNISTNEWTWIKGSSFIGASSWYGSKGISDPLNDPGARDSYAKWIDTQGDFWIMGGRVANSGNDVWKYDLSINEWTWMAGPNFASDQGIYQSQCIFDTTTRPCSRLEHRSSVTDNCGRFWLFGGFADNIQSLSDFWIFDPNVNKWNWIMGNNITGQSGNYGTKGVPSITNMPPSRGGGVSWWGNDNRFYLFGGFQNTTTNCFADLWVFNPDSNCIGSCNLLPISDFLSTQQICPGTCINFINYSFNADSFQWSFPGASPDSSNAENPTNICYATPGNYDVQLIATNVNGSDTLLLANYITVYSYPAAQSITQSGDSLFAIAGSSSYQWYFNGNIITGATNYFYVAQSSGDYNVIATDVNGCEVEAVINNVLAHTPLTVGYWPLVLYPNPVTSTIDIRGLENNSAYDVKIFNVFGEKVFSAVDWKPETVRLDGSVLWRMNCELLPSGLYYIEITSDKKTYRTKFVKSTYR